MRPAILDRLRGVQRAGKGWLCFCPAHDDLHKRSLSVGVGDDGHTLLKCHARNCTPEEITSAVNMSMADLAPGGPPSSPRRREVCTYQYTDGAGTLLFQVLRYAPKDFRQRRPDGQGGWIWNLDGVRRVVYRLPDLAEAPRVYWTEGEKDADRLATLGLTATTSPGGANAWRDDYAAQLGTLGIEDVVILPDHDAPGEHYAATVARACQAAGLVVRVVRLPGLGEHGDVSDWLDAGGTREALLALTDGAPPFDPGAPDVTPAPVVADAAPTLRREGFDLSLTWADGVTLALVAIRDGREGVRGELTVTQDGRRLSWGALALSSTSQREALRKKLDVTAPGPPWGERLDEAAYRLTQAARQGDPFVTLMGVATSPARELLPRLLYEGEPTLLYADGDTGKSLVALALAVAMQSGTALPFGLTPVRAVPAAILDWETGRGTAETRLGLIAAGLGIDPPPILYKRMSRPLVDEAPALAAEFARRGIGLVVIDSKMFAVAGGDGAAFHEPITAFYNALRLFAPAASLVLNHVTNDAAKSGGPARPFGGAFAFNGPRLIWEAHRDHEVDDATAIIFTCRKANNLPRKPAPFGLRFEPGDGTITIYPFDLGEAAPQAMAGLSLVQRIKAALARGPRTVEALAEELETRENVIRATLSRSRGRFFVPVPDSKPQQWALASQRGAQQ